MRLTTTLAAAAALTITGFAANAGGLAPEIVEPEVVVVESRTLISRSAIGWPISKTKENNMRLMTTFAAAAALTISGFAAQAGNPEPAIVEPAPVVAPEPEPAGSSINSTFIVVGVIAALLIAAAIEAD